MTDKPRAADDFEAIRARRDEIRREVDPIDIEVSEEERAAAEAYFAYIPVLWQKRFRLRIQNIPWGEQESAEPNEALLDIEVSEEERAAAEAYFADISEPEMIYVAPLVEVTVGPLTEVKKVDGD